MKDLNQLTDIRDFTTPLYVFLRRGSSKWSELSIGSDLNMRFALGSLDFAFRDFSFFQALIHNVRTGY